MLGEGVGGGEVGMARVFARFPPFVAFTRRQGGANTPSLACSSSNQVTRISTFQMFYLIMH